MGILNLSPDSFYAGSRISGPGEPVRAAGRMLAEGADLLDLGAVSTRPGSSAISEEEEIGRLLPALDSILKEFPGCFISVDTFRPAVARVAADHGAGMINDIYGGRFSGEMLETVASLGLPYVLMHMQGDPSVMQQNPAYDDVVTEVHQFLADGLRRCSEAGIRDVVIDPGFGFGKTAAHNFALLRNLRVFMNTGKPILAGISRKSMIYRTLNNSPEDALTGTTALHALALLNGASVLRVHDVREAVETVKLVTEVYPGLPRSVLTQEP